MKETIEFVPNKKAEEMIKSLIEDGYQWRCLRCNGIYRIRPIELCDGGHCSRYIDMCRACGCDLFQKLEDIVCKTVEVGPVDGILIFKEHHFKYCECEDGKVWTRDAGTECWAKFKLIEEKEGQKVFKCLKSGLKIVILKSTQEELKEPDEVGSTYIRIPE